jgi:drug/metabolite transporter (DMT)-like permease
MKRQYSVLAVGVISVSFAAVFIRQADAPSLVIATWRMCLAALILAPFAVKLAGNELRQISGKNLAMMLLAGGFLALHFGLWISSLSYTSVATSVVLVTATPIFTAVASYLLFKEKLTIKIVLGITISIGGSILIGYGNWSIGTGELLGAGLALAGALAMAAYLLIGRRLRRHTGLLSYSFVTYSSAAIFLLLVTLISGNKLTGYSGNTYLMFVLLALIPQILGHSSLNWSLKFMPATMVTIAVLGEPIIATILAFFVLSESPTLIEIIGGVLILGGIFIAFRGNKIPAAQL